MNKRMKQILSPMHRIMGTIEIKNSKKDIETGESRKENSRLLEMPVILPQYLIGNKQPQNWKCKSRESELLVNV